MTDLDLLKFELARGFKHSYNSESINASSIRVEIEVEVQGAGPDFIMNITLTN